MWIESCEVVQSSQVHEGKITCLEVCSTWAITAGVDMTVRVSDLVRGDTLHILRGHSRPILAISFKRFTIVSASKNGDIRTWKIQKGEVDVT